MADDVMRRAIATRPIRNGAAVAAYSVTGSSYISRLNSNIDEEPDVNDNLVAIWEGQISDQPFITKQTIRLSGGNHIDFLDEAGTFLSGVRGGTLIKKPITPTQISTNQNDYNPGGSGFYYRITTAGSSNITGLAIGQEDGYECNFTNAGTGVVTFKHQDDNSTLGNRFIISSNNDLSIGSNGMVSMYYDGSSSGWRIK